MSSNSSSSEDAGEQSHEVIVPQDAIEFLKAHNWEDESVFGNPPHFDENVTPAVPDPIIETLIESVNFLSLPVASVIESLENNHLGSNEVYEHVKDFSLHAETEMVAPMLLEKFKMIASSGSTVPNAPQELAHMARINGYALIGCISGMYFGLVSSTGSKHLEMVQAFSKLLDHQASREKQMLDDHKMLGQEMKRYTNQVNLSSNMVATLTTNIHELELIVNDLRSQPLMTPIKSSPVKASPTLVPEPIPVEYITTPGAYTSGFGSLTYLSNAMTFEGRGKEGDLLNQIIKSSLKMATKLEILNLDLEELVIALERDPSIIEGLNGIDIKRKGESYRNLTNQVFKKAYQWSRIFVMTSLKKIF